MVNPLRESRLHTQSTNPTSPTPLSPRSARTSQLRAYIKERRFWLLFGVVAAILAMLAGLIFVAQRYYKEMGGQGFLGARETQLTQAISVIPMETNLTVGINKANVPYYTCGDQLHSCAAFDQPNICCPVKTHCHKTDYTPSGIYCCDTKAAPQCHVSSSSKPQCPEHTYQCSKLTYGGCCLHNTTCTPNGCVKIVSASVLSKPSMAVSSDQMTMSGLALASSTNIGFPTGSPMIFTVTERPGSTTTGIKLGEVAQTGESKGNSLFVTLCLPYLIASIAVVTAGIMGFP